MGVQSETGRPMADLGRADTPSSVGGIMVMLDNKERVALWSFRDTSQR